MQLVQLRLSGARSPLTRVGESFRLSLAGFFPLLADHWQFSIGYLRRSS